MGIFKRAEKVLVVANYFDVGDDRRNCCFISRIGDRPIYLYLILTSVWIKIFFGEGYGEFHRVKGYFTKQELE